VNRLCEIGKFFVLSLGRCGVVCDELSHSQHTIKHANRKLVTAVLTAGVAVHSTLYADYNMPPHLEGEKHVFSDLQTWYRGLVDTHVWKLPPVDTNDATHQQQQQVNATLQDGKESKR